MVTVNNNRPTTTTTDRRQRDEERTHTVRAGDTLSAIAAANGVSLQQLIAANPQIRNPNLIHPGQEVRLPDRRGDAPAAAAPSTSAPAAPASSSAPNEGPRRIPDAAINVGALRAPGEAGAAAIPANARVAVIGDSHTAGAFGNQLRDRLGSHLQSGGGQLTSFNGTPSAGVSQFLNGTPTTAGGQTFQTPRLDDVLRDRPDVLVVGLGSNMLQGSPAQNQAQIRQLLDRADAAGTRVVWVGPPNMRGYGGNMAGDAPEGRFYDALNAVNAERSAAGKQPMTIVDSRGSTNEANTADGVHFQGAPARAWADQVFTDATRGTAPTSTSNSPTTTGPNATAPTTPSSNSPANVTAAELRQIVPNLPAARAEEVAQNLNAAMREANITTPRQKAAFIAQLAHESGGFRYMEEIASGRAYEGRRDLGNTQPGDGERFKGRGYIQLTGRANYAAAGRALGLDLVNHPELAARPENAARVAAWFWNSRGLNPIAERGDFREVTRRINGGYNGMESRQHFYDRALPLMNGGLTDGSPTGGSGASTSTGGANNDGGGSSNVGGGSGGAHVVEAGDSLTAIAQRNGTTVAELLRLNPNITNANRIYPGQRITLPGGAAAAATPESAPATTPSQTPSMRTNTGEDLVPEQYNDNTYSEARNRAAKGSTCGPMALIAMKRALGDNGMSADEAVNLARSSGLWDADNGMHGFGAFSQMANQAGVPFTAGAEKDIREQVTRGPVVISTAQHYFVAQGYDGATGKYFVGNSGTVLRGGSQWMSLDEIRSLGKGINGVGWPG